MPLKVLTDRALKALKPAALGRRDVHWDAAQPGFGVRVTDKGSARFIVMRRLGKDGALKRRNIGLSWTVPLADGQKPPLLLADAREKARRALEDMRAGIDPADTKEAEAAEAKRRADSLFGVVAERFIADHVTRRKLKRGAEIARTIRTRLIPLWERKPLGEITRQEIARMLAEVARDHPYSAHHLHSYLRKLFNWALAMEAYGLAVSPCDRIKAADVIGAKHPRQRVLDDRELKAIWQATAIDGRIGYPLAPFVRALLLTGQRLREVAEAKWAEIDLGDALWTIAPTRMKGNAAHEIPLSDAAVALLNALPRGAGPFVFSTSDGRVPISGFSKLKARLDRALEGVEPWRFHDLRRTMRTGLGGLPVPTNVAELVIAHAQPGLHKVYDQHRYRDEKAQALGLWAAKLLSIVEPSGGDVLPFTARA
jgi:integrase